MCGIIGVLHHNNVPVDGPVLYAMTHALSHRGPDGAGVEIRGPVGFGHRRLSIIDPSGGKQPMFNEDRQVWVTFNGEIYNYHELRRELQGKGHNFVTNSDTETIVHAYEEWGTRCVEHFRGMFAFGIMDWREGRLFIARDHFGIKPLYYMETPDSFAFASEIQSLGKHPGFRNDLDLSAVDQFLRLQYIPAPKTAFSHVRKLPPAHHMSIYLDGSTSGPVEYWRVEFRPDNSRSIVEWEEALDATLRDSVKAHLVSDVPFGAFLSGGVDSSLVIGYMTQLLDRPIRAFSIGFDESEFNELDYARFAAQRWGAEHHIEIVKPDALSMLPELVRHYGDLFGDSSAIPTYYVSQVARKHVPMILSGDGADESFAGYWSYGHWMKKIAAGGNPDSLDDWLSFITYIDNHKRSQLWRPEFQAACPTPLELFEREFAAARRFSPCNKVQYMDLKSYLPYDILTKVDIASMMHGLEVRTPFVDVNVVEFAATIPERLNVSCAPDGEWNRKLLLKRVGERYFPKEFMHRPKMGFAVPIATWFAPGGALHNVLHERLLDKSSILGELFEPAAMAGLIRQNATGPLWLLLYLEEWLRQNCSVASDNKPEQAAVSVETMKSLEAEKTKEENMPKTKPRILLIADVPNWIFERHCFTLKRLLSDEFEFTVLYDNQPYAEQDFDLIYPLEWYKVQADRIKDPMKYVSAIRSHLVWTDYDFNELAGYLDSRFNLIHVVSKRLFDIFSPHLRNIAYVSHGVDTGFFTPSTQSGKSGHKLRLGWAGNRKSVGKKGFAEFIEPLGHLPGVELVFCGYSDRNLTLNEMREFYDSLDAYICASDFEGNNNSLLEAASMARAIITTDNGTVPEYLRDGENALVVERDLQAFIQAVETLRDNPQLRDRLGANARKSVVDAWDWSCKGEEYRQLFRMALSRQTSLASFAPVVANEGRPFEKRVLIAAPFFWPSIGGVEIIAENMGRHLIKRNCQIDVATYALPNRIANCYDGMNIIPLDSTPSPGSGVPRAQEQLRNLISRGDYDACIMFVDPTNWVLWSLEHARIPSKTRIIVQTVINIDDYARWKDNTDFRSRLARLLKTVDRVTTLSPSGPAAEYLAAEGVASVFVPNATEPLPAAAGFREKFGIPGSARLILHVANIWPVKNHLGLLDALQGMPEQWHLVMVGSPAADHHHAAYGNQVMSVVAGTPNVTLIPGLLPEQVSAAMASADVVVLASHGEVSPVTILEAMSHGKPWLATPQCGAVHDHAGGIITPLYNFQTILRVLFDHPEISRELGSVGKEHWQSCYTWDVVADAWKEMICGNTPKNAFGMPVAVSGRMRILADRLEKLLFPNHDMSVLPQLPAISFCIITGGKRPKLLELAIKSIHAQKIPAYEIIVIGKHRQTPGITYLPAEEAASQGRLGAMRNLGVASARYENIAILDDDIILSTDWYKEFVRYGTSFDILTSQVRVPDGSRYWDHCTHGGPRGHILLEGDETDDHLYMTGGGGWVMKSHVARSAAWDNDRGFYNEEDTSFSALCSSLGFSILHNHRMLVYHADGVYTGIGRWIARRSEGRSQEWVEPALAGLDEQQILQLANEFLQKQHYAEVADCIRMGLLMHRDSTLLKTAWQEVSGNWGGELSDSRWIPQGDPAFLNTVTVLQMMDFHTETYQHVQIRTDNNATPRSQNPDRLSIIWEGPQFIWHSMAHVNRELCMKLIEMGHELSLHPCGEASFGPETVPRFAPLREQEWKPLAGEPDVTIRHWYPPDFTPPVSGHWVMMQPWEMGSIPKAWIEGMRDKVDELWVYTSYVRDCYIRSGFPAEQVVVMPIGIDTNLFSPDVAPLKLETGKKWKFLYVGATTLDRKGFDILINSYVREFTKSDDVTLVVKDMAVYTGGNNPVARQLRELQARPGVPEILVIEEDLTPDKLAGLYSACNCLVHSYRGEGFSLPIAEAMAMELPVIVTGHGACLDFCDAENAFLIPAQEVKVPTLQVYGLETVDNPWWAEPDGLELQRLMRFVLNNPEEGMRKGKAARARIQSRFTWDVAGQAMQLRLQSLKNRPIRRFTASKALLKTPTESVQTKDHKNILMVAPILPTFDRDSGSFRLFQIIRILRSEGHHITFIARGAAGGAEPQPYIQSLRDIGVEVYPIDPDKLEQVGFKVDAPRIDLERILNERRYDMAYIYFYHIAFQYMDEIKSLSPSIKVLVDSVDLHFLREQREAELTNSSKALLKSQQTKQIELAIYSKADMVIAVTEADKQELLLHAPGVSVNVIPNIHPVQPEAPSYDSRKDILFVGGFPHTPNVDAVLYFCAEIWPIITRRLPQARLFLVGNSPPDSVKALANDRIIVTGYVAETLPYLHHCRVSIAPLRYGAGMKGKVGEALAAGLPVVATSIAAEGTGLVCGRDVLVADDPAEFADAVVTAYQDKALWERLSRNGKEFMSERYSPEAITSAVLAIMKSPLQPLDTARAYTTASSVQVRDILRQYGKNYYCCS